MMLKESLESTTKEAGFMKTEISNTENKMATLEKSIMTLHTKIKELRDEIVNQASQ
jgi:phage shock protein A